MTGADKDVGRIVVDLKPREMLVFQEVLEMV